MGSQCSDLIGSGSSDKNSFSKTTAMTYQAQVTLLPVLIKIEIKRSEHSFNLLREVFQRFYGKGKK